MTELQVYWWLMLDNISCGLTIMSILSGLGVVIAWIIGIIEQELRPAYFFTLLFIVLFPAAVLVPSSRQYATIKVLPKIANNEVVQEIPEDMANMYKVAKEYLKEMVKEEVVK